jgi:hypothetical protein
MNTGPNMARLRDSSAGASLVTCVLAGPGDLLVWEVRVTVDIDGLPLEVSGRGTDLEAAAAAAMPILTSLSPAIFGQAEIGPAE